MRANTLADYHRWLLWHRKLAGGSEMGRGSSDVYDIRHCTSLHRPLPIQVETYH